MSGGAVTAWYLLSIATGQVVGPMSHEACVNAEVYTAASGIECRHADVWTMCPFPDHPGTFQSCPVFDLPKITIKKGKP